MTRSLPPVCSYWFFIEYAVESYWRITPQISDAPMRVTQNTFMPNARSLHLPVIRQPD